MTYWHITIASENRMPLFPSEARRRQAVRAVVRVGSDCLVLFCIVDDHVHVLVVCAEERVGRVRAGLFSSLKPLTEAPLALPHAKPVRNRDHLQWLVQYFLTQPDHHGLCEELALYSGSCYLDLVGARRLPGWETRLFRAHRRRQSPCSMRARPSPWCGSITHASASLPSASRIGRRSYSGPSYSSRSGSIPGGIS